MNPAPVAHPWAPYKGDFETSPVRNFGEVSNALLALLEPEIEPNPVDGTALANIYPTLGVAAESAPRSRRGGARNSAARQSHAITTRQIAELQAAERYAREIGLPFTRMTTIHWKAAGVPLDGMARATGRFIDLLTKTLARHGSKTAWLWVHENGDKKGWHCHLLFHLPASLAGRITRLQRGWLRRITGKPYKRGVIHSKPIGGRLGDEEANPEHHALNLAEAFGYVLKGASPEAGEHFELERLEPGGLIVGKRCGTSQNIGQKARN
ncbi:hypothetical protein [Aurantiacibacter gilvus]|uniref:Inovirus Gp2 family protein n=1 Tax=Aurantiacibacter gilvus TaxID=3139141 RepID=A0ABU9II88_9SPHN